MERKKILILGVSHPQIDAILYCREKGYEVLGLSNEDIGVGIPYLDHFFLIDVIDKDKVLDFASENKIDLIYSTGSDIAMPTVSYVSKRLSLIYDIDEDILEKLTNKRKMREFILLNNLNPVIYKEGNKLEDFNNWNIYPSVIKPIDSQGQRGVKKISSKEELAEFLPVSLKFSKKGSVIIEEYLEGQEVNILTYIFNREIIYIFVIDRILFEEYYPDAYKSGISIGVAKKHIVPSKIPKPGMKIINDYIKNFCFLIGIKSGIVYFQGKYKNGDFKLIEACPRLDGGHIYKIIKLKYGIDLLDICFERLLGKIENRVYFQKINENNKFSYEIEFFHQKPGEYFMIPDNFNRNNPLEYMFYYKENERIKNSNGFFEKTGYQLKQY